ncbi:fimbria/pilus outer membrane usher protein [Amantichitinum ursilacus]|uniref:Outer membrane usher protein HtrE n=1 Tax=Amantichitinum ursilacus TaxID=857265 RepID=A0A0N0GQE5_9NEIS|nr:fimbria/pilus outer membrane usher protein [Amantichitinum ursilacus]KPC54613.1 Outer membrane usher protein HtrE precursor [Amantichitinum ursilacus]
MSIKNARLVYWLAIVAIAPSAAPANELAPDDLQNNVPAESIEFDDSFVSGAMIDLSRFARGNPMPVGTSTVDVLVNGAAMGKEAITFKRPAQGGEAQPCLPAALLQRLGVDAEMLLARAAPDDCSVLQQLAGAQASFDVNEQRLALSVPQLYLQRGARGAVNPARWDAGITAATLQYDLNLYRTNGSESATRSAFLGMLSGLNVEGWRLRYRSSLNRTANAPTRWQSLETWAQHDITPWRAQLTLGQAYTDGQLFDSYGFRGARINRDDRMLGDAETGFAPVVHGVATSNARVSVMQNGNLLYQTTVAPGPFALEDLYATGYGGDLDVTITEADGSEKKFSVPYAAVAQLLRPGQSRFSFVAGKLQDGASTRHPALGQGTWQYGLNNTVTAYGGLGLSDGYVALLLGGAFNTRWGALALDGTQSRTTLPGEVAEGSSWRASYSKTLPGTHTDLTLAAYRYNTAGYYSLRDAEIAIQNAASGGRFGIARMRNRAQVSLSQTLPAPYGSFYVTASHQNYWNRPEADLQYQLGYSNVWGVLSYSASVQRYRPADAERASTQVFANLSVPFGVGTERPLFNSLSATFARSSDGHQNLGASASGTQGDFSYGLNGYSTAGQQGHDELGAYASYATRYGTLNSSASQGKTAQQLSLGASGSMVAYRHGLVFGPPLQTDSAIAIVEADGAAGAALVNGSGARIDQSGRAIMTNLMPYRSNEIALDPNGISADIELKSTSAAVVPRAGAVLLLRFETDLGRSVTLNIERDANAPVIPLGAEIFDEHDNNVGVMGQGGRAYTRGIANAGVLHIRWGSTPDRQCAVRYVLPDTATQRPLPVALEHMRCD